MLFGVCIYILESLYLISICACFSFEVGCTLLYSYVWLSMEPKSAQLSVLDVPS